MGFVEIMPPVSHKASSGTGVKLSITERCGWRLSFTDAAIEALGGVNDKARLKVLVDADPAFPRVRIEIADEGPFRFGKPPISDRCRFVTLGRINAFPMPANLPLVLPCTWEMVEGKPAIDVDLPRELRATQQATHPLKKTGGGKAISVTLAGRSPVAAGSE